MDIVIKGFPTLLKSIEYTDDRCMYLTREGDGEYIEREKC